MNISVIIPVYNAEKLLHKAVASASQFIEVKEILLIDDGSTDNSLQVCKKLATEDIRIKVYRHPDKKNHGAGATRNLGLEKATEDFIAFLDADDYYLPNRFDAEKKLFKDSKVEGVFGAIGTEFISEKGKKEFQEKFKNNSLTTVNFAAEGKDVFLGLLDLLPKKFGTFFHLNTLTIKRKSISKHHLKFNNALRVHQDSDFIIKLAHHCYLKTGNIREAISIRGIHDDNRITKIKNYSKKYNERQLLLWTSLYQWSKNSTIEKNAKKAILLKYTTYELANASRLKKILILPFKIIQNPYILKTRYRFTYLNK